jgi:hypothetical protein
MVKNVYLEQVCLNGIQGSKKGSVSENTKIAGENNVDCILYAKGIIHKKFVTEKQTVTINFMMRFIAGVHCIRPEFQESGSWYLMHDKELAHSLGVLSEF